MESDLAKTAPRPQVAHRGRALLLLAPVVIAPTLGTLSALWFWPGPLGSAIYATCKAVLYGLPFIFWFKCVREDRPSFKLDAAGLVNGLGSGVVIGGLILMVWFLMLEARTDTSSLVSVVEENGLGAAWKFWLFGAWLCIGNSLLEEIAFRWFVDGRLRTLQLPWHIVIPISAAIFTLHHVFVLSAYFGVTLTVLGSAGVFAGGALWSILRARSSSLTPGWISHAIVDLAIILIGAAVLAG